MVNSFLGEGKVQNKTGKSELCQLMETFCRLLPIVYDKTSVWSGVQEQHTICECNFVWHSILIWLALKLFCVGSQFMTDHYPFFLPPPFPCCPIFSSSLYTLVHMTRHLSILASWSLYPWNISYPWNFLVSFKQGSLLILKLEFCIKADFRGLGFL